MKRKHLLIGIVGLAVVAAIVISIDDNFPPEYVRGTIGVADTVVSGVEAASRYRTEQISADDVQLGDTEIQKLLQNDAFIALVQDPKFAKAIEAFNDLEKALEDEAKTKAIEGPDGGANDIAKPASYMDALEDQKIMTAIQDGTTRKALFDDDVKRLIVSPLWEAMIKDQNVRDYIGAEAVKGGNIDRFKADRDGDRPADNDFKTGRDGDKPADNDFKGLQDGDVASDNEFKSVKDGEVTSDNNFKALEDGDIAADHEFKALQDGDVASDNNFETADGGEVSSDNNFETADGGEVSSDNNFEAIADDVREVIESQNFKKAVQDNPGFWKQVSQDPGFAKAIQENYEAIEAFGKIPEPVFAKAIEAIGEGLDVIQGGESAIGDLAKTPAPVFGLVAQDPSFESILGGVSTRGGETSSNDR